MPSGGCAFSCPRGNAAIIETSSSNCGQPMGGAPQPIHFHSMQKTTLSQASRIFSAIAAGAMLLLLAGCNLTITNLTPDTVPQNPSQIYTITASFRPSSQTDPASIQPRIVVDGQAHPMTRSSVGADIWEFDYQLPAGRPNATYYFICDF